MGETDGRGRCYLSAAKHPEMIHLQTLDGLKRLVAMDEINKRESQRNMWVIDTLSCALLALDKHCPEAVEESFILEWIIDHEDERIAMNDAIVRTLNLCIKAVTKEVLVETAETMYELERSVSQGGEEVE